MRRGGENEERPGYRDFKFVFASGNNAGNRYTNIVDQRYGEEIEREKERIQAQLKPEEQEVQTLLADAETARTEASKMHWQARKTFVQVYLPTPRLQKIAPDYYTGWGYVRIREGVWSIHRGENQTDVPRFLRAEAAFSPYFILQPYRASTWNGILREGRRDPLDIDQVRALKGLPHARRHSEYFKLKGLPIPQQLDKINTVLYGFSEGKSTVPDSLKEEAAYIAPRLAALSIVNEVAVEVPEQIFYDVTRRMRRFGITVFRMRDSQCIVSYRNKVGAVTYQFLNIPDEQQEYFQKYLSLGDSYMSEEELLTTYRLFVDVNKKQL